jgi:hypothetical protein
MHGFYSTSDVVVNTLPSSEHTQKFVSEAAFKSMKNDAIFVNIGRGVRRSVSCSGTLMGSRTDGILWFNRILSTKTS